MSAADDQTVATRPGSHGGRGVDTPNLGWTIEHEWGSRLAQPTEEDVRLILRGRLP